MKTILVGCMALITTVVFSQVTVTKEVGDFNELKVFDLMVVTLIPSNENKVVIKGEHADDVKIINDNGKLKLRMEVDTRFRGEDTFIEVYFKKIEIIDANEGTYIVGNDIIEQNSIELRAQEGGRIKVKVSVENAQVKAVSGGSILVVGESTNQKIQINTGGIFEGREFQTENTKINITAAGEAEINASKRVKVRVTAGGDVSIYGNPKEIDEKRLAGGRIKIMNQ